MSSMEAIISGSGRGVTRLRLPFDLEHAPEVLIVFGVAYRAVLAVNGVGHYHPAPDHFVYYVKREDMGPEYRP